MVGIGPALARPLPHLATPHLNLIYCFTQCGLYMYCELFTNIFNAVFLCTVNFFRVSFFHYSLFLDTPNLSIFFKAEYQFRSTFFVIDIFWWFEGNKFMFVLQRTKTTDKVVMVCLEKDYNGKRPQWKKDTRKKFTVHRKTAWKILVKRSQYIQRPHWVRQWIKLRWGMVRWGSGPAGARQGQCQPSTFSYCFQSNKWPTWKKNCQFCEKISLLPGKICHAWGPIAARFTLPWLCKSLKYMYGVAFNEATQTST